MPNFNYATELRDVEPAVSEALKEMYAAQTRAMQKIVLENKRLSEKVNALTRDKNSLSMENQRLRDENRRLQDAQRTAAANGGANRRVGPEEVEARTGDLVFDRTITMHDGPVHSVCITNQAVLGTPDVFMATASWDATVRLYDLQKSTVLKTLGIVGGHNASQPPPAGMPDNRMGGLYAVAFAKTKNNSNILGCTSCDRNVYIWNYQTGEKLRVLSGHSDEVNGIDFHSSQQVVCTASDDCKVLIWDFQEGITLRNLDKHTKAVYGASFLGEENQFLVATCCFDQKIRIFDMRSKNVVQTLHGHTDDVIGIDYSPAVQALATGSDDGMIMTWDGRQSWKLSAKINTQEISNRENEVKRVAFSPDGNLLAGACSSGQVLVYDYHTLQLNSNLQGHTDCVFDVAWGTLPSTGRKILTSASHDNSCRYWIERR